MEKRRVVITGLGTVNPLGNNTADSWAAARAGKCGIGPITQFDASEFKCKLAGEVIDGLEAALGADIAPEGKLQGLSVEVGVAAEDVCLNCHARRCRTVYRGAHAYVGHRFVAQRLGGIHPRSGHKPLRHIGPQIGGGKSDLSLIHI